MLRLEDLTIDAIMLSCEERRKFYEIIGIYSEKHRQYLLITRDGNMNHTEDCNQMDSEVFDSWSDLNGAFTHARNTRFMSDYRETNNVTFNSSKQIFTSEAVQARVAYLNSRGIIRAFTYWVNLEQKTPIVRFFDGCGVKTKDDMSDFLLSVVRQKSSVSGAPKVRSAPWGSW